MTASRELDALVAEKVFGWVPLIEEDAGTQPYYSTDIAAAWEVIEKLSKNHSVNLTQNHQPNHLKWNCKFWLLDGDDVFYDTADAAPIAICLAALQAVGCELPQETR